MTALPTEFVRRRARGSSLFRSPDGVWSTNRYSSPGRASATSVDHVSARPSPPRTRGCRAASHSLNVPTTATAVACGAQTRNAVPPSNGTAPMPGRREGSLVGTPQDIPAGRPAAVDNDRMPFDLERFVQAQEGVYAGVVDELRRGRKTGHWIWFVFPQIAGLGRSETSMRYAIGSLEEARAYLAHRVLGPRLLECARDLLAADPAPTAAEILGDLDAQKVRSSMTLFHRADPEEPVFRAVLDRFYDGKADAATDRLLSGG